MDVEREDHYNKNLLECTIWALLLAGLCLLCINLCFHAPKAKLQTWKWKWLPKFFCLSALTMRPKILKICCLLPLARARVCSIRVPPYMELRVAGYPRVQ